MTTKNFIDSAGAELVSSTKLTEAITTATDSINEVIDISDYLNAYPKIGFDTGYNEAPINADFKYALGTPNGASFSVIDKDAKQVIYYSTTTPTGFVSVFRAYRYSTADNLIFDNDPISLTFLNANERLHSFCNVGTNFILAKLVSTVAPITVTRFVLIKTNASSLWTDWTFAYNVTDLMVGASNLYLVQDKGNDYILRVTGMTGPVLTVYDSAQTLLRTLVLIDNSTDLDLVDRTGQGRTGITGLTGGYNAQGFAPPFTWNPHTQSLHQKHSGYVVQTNSDGSKLGVNYGFSVSWNIPLSWITSGAGTPTNLISIKNSTYRYRVYKDSTWDTDAGGMSSGDSATTTSIVTDEFSGELHLLSRSAWGTTTIGYGQILKYIPNTPPGTFGSYITNRQLAYFSLFIPDGSAYAKSIISSGALLIGDYVLFIGESNQYGTRQLLTKYSSDSFMSVVNPNDTLVLNSASANIDPLANAPDAIKSKGTNLRFNTAVVGGVPTYSTLEPGQSVMTASMVGSVLTWTTLGISFPAIPSTISGKTGFTHHGAYAWNGSVSSPVFYALVKTATYFYMAKYSAGAWSIPGAEIGKSAIDSGNESRGDSAYIAYPTLKNNLLTESGLFMCEFTMPMTGYTVTYLITYNTNNNIATVVSPDTINSTTPTTNLYNYTNTLGRYEAVGTYGYNEKFGYFALRSPLDRTSTRILSSKDIRGIGAPISESDWYSNTNNSRYEIVISTTSSVGLIAYISEYPIFLGGYHTKIPRRAVTLLANSINYIYAYKTTTKREDVEILVSPNKTSNSFSKVCLAKITTGADKITAAYIYSIDGAGLPDQENKASLFLRSNGKTTYWSPLEGEVASTVSKVSAAVPVGSKVDLVTATMANNDYFKITVSDTGSDNGYVEIATGDNGTEPIYVRQYGIGGVLTRSATLLDSTGNTSFPGSVSALSVTQTSDERLKTNWNALPSNFLQKMASVKYGTFDFLKNGHPRQIGVSAQDLQAACSEAVQVDQDGYLSINAGGAALVTVLSLLEKVTVLEKRIVELEKKSF